METPLSLVLILGYFDEPFNDTLLSRREVRNKLLGSKLGTKLQSCVNKESNLWVLL